MKWKIIGALALTISLTGSVQSVGHTPKPVLHFNSVVIPTTVPNIVDPLESNHADPRPNPKIVQIPIVKNLPQPTQKVYSGSTLKGLATWYCNKDASRGPISRCRIGYPSGHYAAINWRYKYLMGSTVQVCITGTSICTSVKIVDCIQCSAKDSNTLIDLYADAFDDLRPLSVGTIASVSVSQ